MGGASDFGQRNVPTNLSNVVQIAAGRGHALALKADGTVVAWGAVGHLNFGQAVVPNGLEDVVQIAAGDFHSLALKRDGTVVAWGANWASQATVPADLGKIARISAKGANSLALSDDNKLTVWGGLASVVAPSELATLGIVDFCAGEDHAIALLSLFDSDSDGVNDYREGKDRTNPNDARSFNPLSKGLVAYYPFDGNANDESGYSRHIQTETEGLDFAQDRFCSEGDALALTQAFSASSTVYFEATAPRTFSQWVKVVEFPARTDLGWFKQDVPIAAFPQSVVLGNTFASDGEWWLDTGSGIAFYDFPLTTSWTQITVVYEGNVVDGKVYRNGAEVPMKSWAFSKTQFDSRNYNSLASVDVIWNYTNTSASNLIDEVRVYSRALSPSEVKSLFHETAFTVDERVFLTTSPSVMGHYSHSDYNANRTNGQIDVMSNPSAFNLFTQAQFESSRISGQSDVINNPMSYGLYTADSIMDLRMGGFMVQKIGTNAVVSFQPQTTTDLTQPFTNNGTPISHTIPMPGNKGFIRINAKP